MSDQTTSSGHTLPFYYFHNKPKSDKKHSRLSRLYENVTKFADEISFTGLKYTFGSIRGHYVSRVLWFLVFFACMFFGIYLFRPIWTSYFTGSTVIVIDEDKRTEMEYPTVTICNMNKFRRSVIGGAPEGYLSNVQSLQKKKGPLCSAPKLYERYPNLDRERIEILYNVDKYVAKYAFFSLLTTSATAYQSVMWCKYRGRTLSKRQCYSSFINTMIFEELCFMFNPSNQTRFVAVSDDDKPDGSESSKDPTFPKQVANEIRYTAKATGGMDSVEFLLNLQQYEYCMSGDSDGVGFKMQVHSSQTEVRPIIMALRNDNIRLSPGKEVIALIKEVKYKRQTEAFGRCLRKITYRFFPDGTDYYQDACINDCVTEIIQHKCKCLPMFAPIEAHNEITRNASQMGIPPAALFCMGPTQTWCVNSVIHASIVQHCSRCKKACEEANYVVHVTYNDFPAQNAFDLYKGLKYPRIDYNALRDLTKQDYKFHEALNLTEYIDPWSMPTPPEDFKDINEVRQNLLLLRLQYFAMNVETIIEKLDAPLSGMVSQFGGLLGLFVGASIISFVEIIYWIIVCCKSVIMVN